MIQRRNARREIRRIGKIQILHTRRNAGTRHAVRITTIGLKWPAGIHHHIRRNICQTGGNLCPVHRHWLHGRRPRIPVTKPARGGLIAPRNHQRQISPIRQQMCQPPTKCPITAKDQNFHITRLLGPMLYARCGRGNLANSRANNRALRHKKNPPDQGGFSHWYDLKIRAVRRHHPRRFPAGKRSCQRR